MYMYPLADIKQFSRQEIEQFSKNWWLVLLTGIIAIIVGLVILDSTWTLGQLALFFGILLILRGVIQASSPGFTGGSRTWNIAVGILSILVGIAAFLAPFHTLMLIAAFVGIWLIVTGLFDIVGSIASRRTLPYWWLALIRGIIAVPLGFWALDRPILTLSVLIFVFGIWAIVIGILDIALSVEIKHLPRTLAPVAEPQPGMA